MNAIDRSRPPHARTGTSDSNFSAHAPLISSAADMGYSRPESPGPSLPNIDLSGYNPPRPGTANSQRSVAPRGAVGANNGLSLRNQAITESPAPMDDRVTPFPPPARNLTGQSTNGSFSQQTSRGPVPAGMQRPGPPGGPPPQFQQSMRSATGPFMGPGPQQPSRNATAPVHPPQQDDYFGSAPSSNPYGPPARNLPGPPPRNVSGPGPGPTTRAPGGDFNRPSTSQSMRGGPPRNMTGSAPPRKMTGTAPPPSSVGDYMNRSATPQGMRGGGAPRPNPNHLPAPRQQPGGDPYYGYDVEAQYRDRY